MIRRNRDIARLSILPPWLLEGTRFFFLLISYGWRTLGALLFYQRAWVLFDGVLCLLM